MERKDLTPDQSKKMTSEETKKTLKYQRDRDREMVRGKFNFNEVPGGRLEFSFKKYQQDETEHFDFIDGHIYTIPRGVAVHLNTNGAYPTYTYVPDEYGRPVTKIGTKTHRFSFTSLEFTEDDELIGIRRPSLVTVEAI